MSGKKRGYGGGQGEKEAEGDRQHEHKVHRGNGDPVPVCDCCSGRTAGSARGTASLPTGMSQSVFTSFRF